MGPKRCIGLHGSFVHSEGLAMVCWARCMHRAHDAMDPRCGSDHHAVAAWWPRPPMVVAVILAAPRTLLLFSWGIDSNGGALRGASGTVLTYVMGWDWRRWRLGPVQQN